MIGHNINSVDDIASSMMGLQHTTVFELVLDCSVQQPTATSLSNISRLSQICYQHEGTKWVGIVVREQNFFGKGTFLSRENLERLWGPHFQHTTNSSIKIPTTSSAPPLPTPPPTSKNKQPPLVKISHKKTPPLPSLINNKDSKCQYCKETIM